MSNKSGTKGRIVQRSKGSWSIVVDVGRDPSTGKRRQQRVTIRGTKADAQRKLAEVLHQLDTGTYVKPAKITTAEYLRQWLRDYALINVRTKTHLGYVERVEKHLIPQLGAVPLSQLTPAHVQAAHAYALTHRLDGKPGGLSPRSVAQHHRILSEALSHAVRWNIVPRNVAKAVNPPRWARKEMATFDAQGAQRLLDVAQGTVYHPILHLAVYTGLRRSELLALKWEDIDLDLASLRVVRTIHQLKGGELIYGEPKTDKSRRRIPLTPNAVLALRLHKEREEAICDTLGAAFTSTRWLFCGVDGNPYLPDRITKAFKRFAKKAGLPHLTLHSVRHSFATLLLGMGTHAKVTQEMLGHSSITVTMDLYSHAVPGLMEAAALKLDEALSLGAKQTVAIDGASM